MKNRKSAFMKKRLLSCSWRALGLLAVAFASCMVHATERPNVILIVTDDMGYADIGSFGCKDIKTPNLDRIASEGTLFTNAYVSAPVCVPSRMGFLTGRYQQRWGVYGNGDGYTPGGLQGMAQQSVFAEPFQKAGYATALFGKWHLSGNASLNGAPRETLPEQNGFDEVCVIQGGMSPYKPGTLLYTGNGQQQQAAEYLTDHFSTLSVDFINRNKAKPFLLCLTFNAVHAPLQATQSDLDAHKEISLVDRRTYAAMLSAMDRNIGRVLDTLDAAGLEEKTIIAFLSDNGGPAHDARGHSRNMAENGPLRGHKFDILEGGIRVPLLLRWPGKIPAAKMFEGVTSALDLAPTFLSAARLPFPEQPLDGVDLLPFLDGKKSGDPHPTLAWESNWFNKPDCALRRGNWKIVQMGTGAQGPLLEKWELYDLNTDIGEANNVATQSPEIVKELDAAYRKWRSQMPAAASARAGAKR
jgi:arylsulfatase A-like enzyme